MKGKNIALIGVIFPIELSQAAHAKSPDSSPLFESDATEQDSIQKVNITTIQVILRPVTYLDLTLISNAPLPQNVIAWFKT